MKGVDWLSVLDALTYVERLDSDESGLLSLGRSPGGGIFVEKQRICWVAAHGLQRRLRDLLRDRLVMNDAEIEHFYQRCRTEGRPFGQTLLAEGLITSTVLETVLRRHSAESLIKLSETKYVLHWSPRSRRGYSPHFTFRAVDVLFDVVDLLLPQARVAATAALSLLSMAAGYRAAFLLDASTPVPIAAFGDNLGVKELRSLGDWAMCVPLASKELGASPAFTLASTAAGDTVAVWWRGAILYAVVCDDRRSVAALTAHHLACA